MRQMILIGTQAELDAAPAGEYHRATAVILEVPCPDKGVAFRVLKSRHPASNGCNPYTEFPSARVAVGEVLP